MSGKLKELVTAWQGGGPPVRSIRLPTSQTVEAAERIGLGQESAPRNPREIAEIRNRLVDALNSDNFENMDFIAWRYSPFCLEGSDGLIHNGLLLERYLRALALHVRARILRTLAGVYARTFAPGSLATTLLARFLSERTEDMGRKWYTAARRFQLFVPGAAVELLADMLWKTELPPTQGFAAILQQEGLPPGVAASALGRQALQKALQLGTARGRRIDSLTIVDRIIGLTSDGQGGLAMQKHPEVIRGMTDALLLPFTATTATISDSIRSRIESHLLSQLRDPRLDRALWHPVDSDATTVMLGWLTEQSLELFLDIVDRVANRDEDAKRMWRMRGKFWRAYLRNRFIDEAWVVLGDNGIREAQRIQLSTNSGPGKTLSFARLTSSADKKNHIVLIMRIDNLIVVDWSHNGRCHLWLGENTRKPRMYQKQYGGPDLTSESDEQYTHVAGGSWRDKVARTIYRATGRNVTYRDYN